MAIVEQTNFQPTFAQSTVPCDGDVGDLYVHTPLQENAPDISQQGVASLWFCIKAGRGERPAIWARVAFDGVATCMVAIPQPPQNRPTLTRG